MLRIVLVLVGLGIVFAVARLAFRRAAPAQPAVDPADDGFTRNIRHTTGNFQAAPEDR